ncbi:Smooth muscle protein/calponin [Penicillium argentinense]|uniref:Smooth muscle protein/calponin n=1 Tax=Penicillium argentinense TaxID=1131581 RepID=A0A9W9JV74_9EURO|nr:Smooth muscle protein/calponin [Penicillium argentinense]KAJ5082783.1 Smooth muscle protein/calponin [Penicillium argentinense]
MASVTSLDKDLRNMRLSRYTPQAAAEVRDWIEEVLREKLPSRDLLEGLKDGVALCKWRIFRTSYAHVKWNPSDFPPHDVFLTVDLYEAKDPAQVLQCLAAFSRRANTLHPGIFPRSVGPQSKRGMVSPNATGSSSPGSYTTRTGRASSNASDANPPIAGRMSPAKPSGSHSTWSKKNDQGSTAPAWNIHQYGYMGGASQGNQGIAFGARRQITTPGPAVPSLAEKEKRRREEDERIRQKNAQREEQEWARQRELEEQEAQAKVEEDRRWKEETDRLREKERREMEEEKKRWDAEKRQWEEEEQHRVAEEKEAEERVEQERQRRRKSATDARLNGQFLSQYQASQTSTNGGDAPAEETPESRRIKELERELELAKERERQYETERTGLQVQKSGNDSRSRSRSRQRPVPVPPKPSYDLSSLEQERRMLRTDWQKTQEMPTATEEPEHAEEAAPPPQPRPLPQPVPSSQAAPAPPPRELPAAPRPLPDPMAYTANRGRESRVDRFLASNPAPRNQPPPSTNPKIIVDAENSRRMVSQQKTRAGGWASKSLLEREMERERERQREWEENQKKTQAAVRDTNMGSGPGQSWDVHQYGYMGGDNQNRGGVGLGVGGARRQIIGPRPPP